MISQTLRNIFFRYDAYRNSHLSAREMVLNIYSRMSITMRVNFHDLFTLSPNGTITPKTRVKIGGVTTGPSVTLHKKVKVIGVPLSSLVGKDLEVVEKDGVYEIQGTYE